MKGDEDDAGGEERPTKSFGNMSDEHWSRARQGLNEEALEHYRKRSRAPGVAEGGAARNHYCMECDGVVPLEYDSRDSAPTGPERCPHCDAPLDERVRAMFNWVEIDQVPGSDFKALLPSFAVGLLVVLGLWWLASWLM